MELVFEKAPSGLVASKLGVAEVETNRVDDPDFSEWLECSELDIEALSAVFLPLLSWLAWLP